MSTRRAVPRVIAAFTVASCTPAPGTDDGGRDAGTDAGFDAGTDAGTDAGYDAGYDGGVDAGRDAGFDAGTRDAGCPSNCQRGDGGCALPPDFPPDASQFLIDEVCFCVPNQVLWCYDETPERCFSWACFPGRAPDGGYDRQPDGGVQCLC